MGDLALTEGSTAAGFARLAHAAIDSALARGRVPVVAGGTGLYLRAALADLAFPDEPEPELREWSERLVEHDPAGALRALAARDPGGGRARRRRQPAPAGARAAGRAAAAPRRAGAGELWSAQTRRPTLLVAVTRPREELDRRIAERVRRELDDGLVAEIEAALDDARASRARRAGDRRARGRARCAPASSTRPSCPSASPPARGGWPASSSPGCARPRAP